MTLGKLITPPDMEHQGLPGDKCNCAGTLRRPQNNPWGVVNSARRKKIKN
jgi:hypothetical protein